MSFIDVIKERAAKSKKTIVLPESMDARTYEAAAKVVKEGFADIIIVGSPEEVAKFGAGFDLTGVKVVDPATSDRTAAYIDKLVELRQKKGMTPEAAKELLLKDYLYYGVMMVKMGDADGMVSGACHSTADTLRPCLQILKTKPGTKLVSAFFLMVVPDCEYGANGTFVFADSGLVQNPTPDELASIANSSAEYLRAAGRRRGKGSSVVPLHQGFCKACGRNQGYRRSGSGEGAVPEPERRRRVPAGCRDRSQRRRFQSSGQPHCR